MGRSEQQASQDSHPLFIARTLIFIRNAGRFLFIKGSPNKRTWPNLYNAIGGHIEKNESVTTSALRELFEETGLSQHDIYDLRLIGTITIALPEDSPDIILFVLSAFSKTTNVKESAEGSPHWLTPDEILKMPTVADIPILIDRILKMDNTSTPFAGHYWYDASSKLQITFSEHEQI
jgi:8-oxo-dGTP pyrophosphatase MutT (NUDIX family)